MQNDRSSSTHTRLRNILPIRRKRLWISRDKTSPSDVTKLEEEENDTFQTEPASAVLEKWKVV